MKNLYPLRDNTYWKGLSKEEQKALRMPYDRMVIRNWKDWRTWLAYIVMLIGISGVLAIFNGRLTRLIFGAVFGLIAGMIWEHQVQTSVANDIKMLE